MNKVYIEAGCHNGSMCLKKIAEGQYDRYYGIEPNPTFLSILKSIENSHANFVFINSACGNNDDVVDFFQSTKRSDGSTIIKGKKTGGIDYNKPLRVGSFNFSKWIKTEFIGCFIDIRMDIEGAEYIILPKMIEDGSIFLINALSIEFHKNRFDDKKIKQNHKEIIKFFKKNNINYKILT